MQDTLRIIQAITLLIVEKVFKNEYQITNSYVHWQCYEGRNSWLSPKVSAIFPHSCRCKLCHA